MQLGPDYVDFDTALGLIAEAQGRLDDARAHYAKALALEPKDPDARAQAAAGVGPAGNTMTSAATIAASSPG